MSVTLPAKILENLQNRVGDLPPELQRAARWVASHPAEVGLWSMRRQAQELAIAPATMLRLARAAGFDSYESFRQPFRQALAKRAGSDFRQRAEALQAAPGKQDVLTHAQMAALQSVGTRNTSAAIDAAARALLMAPRIGFLGTRSAFGIAYQMRYAFQLVRRHGVLIDGLGGTAADEAEVLDPGDVLVVMSQAPYPAATLKLAQQAEARGVQLVALTDDPLSPLAHKASHVLCFAPPDLAAIDASQQGPGSFFHTTAGLLGLAEHLIARMAALGGQDVLARLAEVDTRLREDEVYWTARSA